MKLKAFSIMAATAMTIEAQAITLTSLVNFGAYQLISAASGPSALTQGKDGNFYGTIGMPPYGTNQGVVFKLSSSGSFSIMAVFNGTNGSMPTFGVVQAKDGNFYGTTIYGGAFDNGTIFKMTPSGMLSTLHSFSGGDGAVPGSLVEGKNGDLYGTTRVGGNFTNGEVFKITTNGVFEILYSFDGTNGSVPEGLMKGIDGNFYGVTDYGGVYDSGTIFRMTPGGTLSILYSAGNTNGCERFVGTEQFSGLIQSMDGNFYGIANNSCNQTWKIFKCSPEGIITTLYSETNTNTYEYENLTLMQAKDGQLYGTEISNYSSDLCEIYRLATNGTMTTFISYLNTTNPSVVTAPLVQGADGNFYGTTSGNIFRLSLQDDPFIVTQPASQLIQAGGTANFGVVADGQPPLSYQWRFNGQNISGATSSTLTLNSVTAANSGGYSVVVSNPYGSVTSATASLAVLTDGANGNTPTQVPMPAAPAKPTGIDSLVVVTHGYELEGPLADVSWVNDMANAIQQQSPANWFAYPYIWKNWASGLPPNALAFAQIQGFGFGQVIANQHWKNVHLIAHSAGAGFIENVAKEIKAISPSTFVQCTFLDPYVGVLDEWRDTYGHNANWTDCYFTQELGLGLSLFTGSFGWTGGNLGHAYNVDVDWTDPNSQPIVYGSTLVAFSAHDWSHEFYLKTITNTDNGWCGANYGFRLSAKGGGESGQAGHPIGNGSNPTVLCGLPGAIPTPNLPIPVARIVWDQGSQAVSDAYSTVVNGAGFALNSLWSVIPHIKSGGIQPLDNTYTNTPAWLAVGVSVTNAVNFVQFDAAFTDTNSAQGLLTVYWNTNQIGMVDERVAETNSQTYRFVLPGTVSGGLYTLSFRLDSFASSSSAAVTNVAMGFVGVTQPITLDISITNGVPLLQLTAATNFTYLIQSSTNLVDWTPTALLLNTNGTAQFQDSSLTNSSARFYRAVMP